MSSAKRKRVPDGGAVAASGVGGKSKSPKPAAAVKKQRTEKADGTAGSGKAKSPKSKMKIAGLNPKKSSAGGDASNGEGDKPARKQSKSRSNPESESAAMSGAGPEKYKNPRYHNADGEKKKWKPNPKSGGANGSGEEKKVALTREDRKELRKTRRANKPNAQVVAATNSVYNVGLKDMKKAERDSKI